MPLLNSSALPHRTVRAVDSTTPVDGSSVPTDGIKNGSFAVSVGWDHVQFRLALSTTGTPAFAFLPYWWDPAAGQWFAEVADTITVTGKGNQIFSVPRRGGRCWLKCTAIDAGGDAVAVITYSLVRNRLI